MNRGSEDMKLWLFDLAHGNLSDEQVLKGFTKYYTLAGFVPGNVQQDMVFHTCYSQEQIASAMAQLIWALQILAGEGGANNESCKDYAR